MKMKAMFRTCMLLVVVFFSLSVRAQHIYVSGIKYNKQQEEGVIAEYNFGETIVKNVVRKQLSALDVKEDKSKGFILYRGIRLNAISPDKIDLYLQIGQAEKGSDNRTVVKMLVSKGYDNFIKEGPDYPVFENIKTFLLSLQPSMAAMLQQQQMEVQDAELKKAEKKRDALKDEIAELQKKIAKLQSELDQRKNELADQHTVVEKEVLKLEELRGKASQ